MALFECQLVNETYMNHTIWQPETSEIPWAVHVEGWQGRQIDIVLHHESLCDTGTAYFRNLKISNARAFADFVSKMFRVFIDTFSKPYIEFRAIDYLALMQGWKEGEEKAEYQYINYHFN